MARDDGAVGVIVVVLSKEVVCSFRLAGALITMTEQIKAKTASSSSRGAVGALGGCSRLLGCQMSTSFSARGGPGTMAGWRATRRQGRRDVEDKAGMSGCDRKATGEDEYGSSRGFFGVSREIFGTPQLTGCKSLRIRYVERGMRLEKQG